MIRIPQTRALPLALALVVAGCQDLNVVNPNLPDATRATTQPLTTESFVVPHLVAGGRPWRLSGHRVGDDVS